MKLEIKSKRLWIPKEIQNKIENNFIEIKIENKDSFVTKITKDGRFNIPKKLRKKLNLRDGSEINIKIKILKKLKRPKKLQTKDQINILHTIPERTLSNQPILVTYKNNKLFCWYSTQGRPNEIIMNKFVPVNFIKLCGLYQAEGGKPRLKPRRGRDLSFTNKSLKLIKDFVIISSSLFEKNLWNATIRYNKDIDKTAIIDVKENLISLGIAPNKIKSKEAKRIKTYTIKLWISNSILAEIISNTNNIIKKNIINNRLGVNEAILYLQGYLAGDGNFHTWKTSHNTLHSELQIFEGNKESAEDCKKIFEKLAINAYIKKSKTKEMYIIKKYMNWKLLLKIFEYDLLTDLPRHQKQLKTTIRNHKRFSTLKYLTSLNINFDMNDLITLTEKDSNYCHGWARDRRKEELIKRTGIKSWCLTNEGIKLGYTLNLVK